MFPILSCLHELFRYEVSVEVYELEVILNMSNDAIAWLA